MAKLSEDLKRMLTGLAYQDAGDFLSRSEKMKVLDGSSRTPNAGNYIEPINPLQKVETSKVRTMEAAKRIAFISNGERRCTFGLRYRIKPEAKHTN